MAQSIEQRLAGYQRRYRELATELADLGYIAAGSITQRSTRCGTPSCRCTPTRPNSTAPTGSGPPRSTERPSPDASVRPTPSSTTSGSATTGNYARPSPECGRSPPMPELMITKANKAKV